MTNKLVPLVLSVLFLGFFSDVSSLSQENPRKEEEKKRLGIALGVQDNPGKNKNQPMLECRIIIAEKFSREGFSNDFVRLEVELKNVSDKAIDIAYTRAPHILQYMKWGARNPDGTIAKANCVDSLSPFSAKPPILTLRPGETTRAHLGSLGAKGPGAYQVQAIFEYKEMKAASPVVELELKAVEKK